MSSVFAVLAARGPLSCIPAIQHTHTHTHKSFNWHVYDTFMTRLGDSQHWYPVLNSFKYCRQGGRRGVSVHAAEFQNFGWKSFIKYGMKMKERQSGKWRAGNRTPARLAYVQIGSFIIDHVNWCIQSFVFVFCQYEIRSRRHRLLFTQQNWENVSQSPPPLHLSPSSPRAHRQIFLFWKKISP